MGKKLTLATALAGLVLVACGYGLAERPWRSVADLPAGQLLIGDLPVTARLAATSSDRRLGFQHASAQQIRHELIYFSYRTAPIPQFHMQNVAAPLLIAWIGPDRQVIAIERMAPGACCYTPPSEAISALELAPEPPLAKRVHPGTSVRLLRSTGDTAQEDD